MIKTVQGKLDAKDLKFAIIVSQFNELVTNRLVTGAIEAIKKTGGSESNLSIIKVPGSFEIPLVARKLAGSKNWDAIICLGAIIKGETPHFDYVATAVTQGITQCAQNAAMPVVYGIITAETVEQAMDRAGLKLGNKGYDAAMVAVEMANLLKLL